jgi:chromosome segregation ATPase
MSYRAALQALTAHENPHLMPPEEQRQLDEKEEIRHMLSKKQEQLQQRVKKLQEDATRPIIAGEQQDDGRRQSIAGQQQQGSRQDTGEKAARELATLEEKLQAVTAAEKELAEVQRKLQLPAVTTECEPLQQQHQKLEALRQVLLDDLVDSKYHLVVSSQNFGVFASKESASNMKAGWLVHSIHALRKRHPTLKVGRALP